MQGVDLKSEGRADFQEILSSYALDYCSLSSVVKAPKQPDSLYRLLRGSKKGQGNA